MPASARVVTYLSKGNYVTRTDAASPLRGLYVELWEWIARDLNLTYQIQIVDSWPEMFQHLNANQADVILQQLDESQLELFNVSK